jgi:toluene monooxygenase system protein D
MEGAVSEKLVGPVVNDSDIADALIEAIERDNPGQEPVVQDHGAYVRIHLPRRCRVTRASLEEALGRPFKLAQLETVMSSFAGRIDYGDEEIVWYLEQED